jgi:phytoene synthase
MMSHVFGVRDDDALVHAAHLGIGMQLTNICRDVAEDAERDRVYIPSELLVHHGMEGSVRELLALADRYYASGAAGEHALPWRAAVAVRAARGIYSAIGSEIAAQDHDVMAGRAVVPRRRKIAHVALATLRTLAELPWRPFARSVRTPTRTLEVGDVPRV